MAQDRENRSRTELLWLAAIIVVAIALRTWSLGADPMQALSGGFISDEGTWWKNPRLHAIWGTWMVDDGNYGILTAPAYTVVMRGVFALLGVGYVQAYTASAVSGVLTIVLVYFLVRRDAGGTAALLASTFVAINALTIPYDRSAYPESFQLMMMTATIAAILTCRGRVWLAGLAGVAVVIVLLSKPPGIVLAPIATITAWFAVWWMDRQTGREKQFSMRALLTYVGVATAMLAIVGVVYLRPYASDVWTHFQIQMSDGAELGAAMTDRFHLFGTPISFRLNDFFRTQWYLIIAAGVFGAVRIARMTRRPVTTIELAAWIWLVMGFGIMSLQAYQVDRRFLFLIPPLSIITAIAASEALEIGESAWTSQRARRIGAAIAAGLVALVVLFYAIPYGVWKFIAAARMLGRTWSFGFAGGVLLSLMILGAAVLGAWLLPQLRFRVSPKVLTALVAIPVVFVLVQVTNEITHLSRGLETVSGTLSRVSTMWPGERVVAAGYPAGTLTMGSGVLPVNHEVKGPSAAERFRPQLELYAGTPGRDAKRSDLWAVAGRPLKVECARLPIWTDRSGKPRLQVHIFVEPDRVAECQAKVHESGAASTVGATR